MHRFLHTSFHLFILELLNSFGHLKNPPFLLPKGGVESRSKWKLRRSSTLDGGRNSFQGLPWRWLEDAPASVVPFQMALEMAYKWGGLLTTYYTTGMILRKITCPLKRGHFTMESSLPTTIFWMDMLVFWGVVLECLNCIPKSPKCQAASFLGTRW